MRIVAREPIASPIPVGVRVRILGRRLSLAWFALPEWIQTFTVAVWIALGLYVAAVIGLA